MRSLKKNKNRKKNKNKTKKHCIYNHFVERLCAFVVDLEKVLIPEIEYHEHEVLVNIIIDPKYLEGERLIITNLMKVS